MQHVLYDPPVQLITSYRVRLRGSHEARLATNPGSIRVHTLSFLLRGGKACRGEQKKRRPRRFSHPGHRLTSDPIRSDPILSLLVSRSLASARPSPCRVASAGGSEIPPVRFTRNAPLARLMILFAFAVLVRRCPPHPGTDPKLYQAHRTAGCGPDGLCARACTRRAMPREAW